MKDVFTTVKQKALRGVFTLTFRRLLLKVIDTVGIIYLARLLPQESFGVFAIISFVVFTFLSFFSDVGLGAALIQKEKIEDDDIKTTFTVQQILVTILLVIAFFAANPLASFYNLGVEGVWLIRMLSLSLFITSFKTIPSILLERDLRFELLVIPEVIETVTYNVVAVVMASSGYGVWSLVVAVVARTLLGAIALSIIKPWPIGYRLAKKSIHDLLHFGVPYQLNSVLALLKDNLAPTVIALWYGPAAVAYVNLAQNISSRPLELSTIVSRITFPTYSRIQGDTVRLKSWIEKSIHLMATLYFPAIIGLLVTAEPILRYLYADKSDKWLPALTTLIFFLLAAVPVFITTTYTNALYALGRPKVVLRLMVLYTVLTWAIGVPLIRWVGYSGIAITVSIITYLTIPLVVHEINKLVRLDTWEMVKRPLLASVIMGAATYLGVATFVSSLLTLVLAIILGGLLYCVLVYALDHKMLKAELAKVWHTLRH
ncbi:oligosaccharide flippase family protein [Candidatus Woesebacteria bacterium]|nr:oligosaccharide flippase family protein [Candidatus Woesebacteria bacterium]